MPVPFAALKLPVCSADPFDDKGRQAILDWLEMVTTTAREAEPIIGRLHLQNCLITRIQLGSLQNQVKAAAREIPSKSFDVVLRDVRDRIAGVTEAI